MRWREIDSISAFSWAHIFSSYNGRFNFIRQSVNIFKRVLAWKTKKVEKEIPEKSFDRSISNKPRAAEK